MASEPAPLREVGNRTSVVTARTILVIVRGRSYRKDRMFVKSIRLNSPYVCKYATL